jgi:hypothetical protein
MEGARKAGWNEGHGPQPQRLSVKSQNTVTLSLDTNRKTKYTFRTGSKVQPDKQISKGQNDEHSSSNDRIRRP